MYRFLSKKNVLSSAMRGLRLGSVISLAVLSFSFPHSAWAQAEDLCPLPSNAISQAPDDLSKVQADIDRFTLCVERAQRLQRLNDLALQNQEAISAFVLGTPDEPLAPVFDDNIPSFSGASQEPAFAPPAIDASFAPSFSGDSGAEIAATPPASTYIVTYVFGSAGSLQAKIIGDGDYNAQVRVGDSLPDGSVVDSISATEVVIKSDSGDSTVLDWQEEESE